MPVITIKVEPEDGTTVGWDVRCLSWKSDFASLTWHKLIWTQDSSGAFIAKTADLPDGTYGVRGAAFGPGRKLDISVADVAVVQPQGSDWPMTVEVDSATETQTSRSWYFANGGQS